MKHIPIHFGPEVHARRILTSTSARSADIPVRSTARRQKRLGSGSGRICFRGLPRTRMSALRRCFVFAATALLCVHLSAQDSAPAQPANPVVQWNRALLVIVRTHGAQPATIHPTPPFALMHVAMYDAVNSIDAPPY